MCSMIIVTVGADGASYEQPLKMFAEQRDEELRFESGNCNNHLCMIRG